MLDTPNETKEYARSDAIVKEDFYYKPVEYTASTTFKKLDYSKEGVSRDTVQIFKTAGYPQLQQVHHTAYNISEILNLDMNSIKANELVWVANKSNRDWDVFRISSANIQIATLESINDSTQLQITFTDSHTLSAGSTTTEAAYFAISNSEDEPLNAV